MFHQPHNLEQALHLRSELASKATVINGGTDVVVLMNRNELQPEQVLDISQVKELRNIDREGDSILIGAGATHAELGKLPVKALSLAALSIGGPSIRNMGTVGGNIASASPAADVCVALLALGAELELTSAARGSRWIKLQDYFKGYRQTALAEDELLTRLRIPSETTSGWYKLGKRGAVNISMVCCAAARRPEKSMGIAFGCVGPFPQTAPKAEALLSGSELTAELIDQAAETILTEVNPIDDHRASAEYRRQMCKVIALRVLNDIAAGSEGGNGHA